MNQILEFLFGHKWKLGKPYEYNGAYCIDWTCERYKIPEIPSFIQKSA